MTNIATAPAQTVDLQTALSDLAILALVEPDAAGKPIAAGDLKSYLKQLEHIGGLAGELGYVGIQTLCLLFQDHLESQYWKGGNVNDQLLDALKRWPMLVTDYLTLPPGLGALDAIVHHLRLPFWDAPFSDEDIAVFQGLLRIEHPQETGIPTA